MCEINIASKSVDPAIINPTNNITACQVLTNLCVLIHSDLAASSIGGRPSACSKLMTITQQQIKNRRDVEHNRPGWFVTTVLISLLLSVFRLPSVERFSIFFF